MSRPLRLEFAGALYHVTARGNARADIFRDDEDRALFLDRVGHVLQGRYQAIVVDQDSYLKELIRYVVLNPVRAKLVRLPERWAWSSYRATAGLSAAPPWLAVDEVRGQFGGSRAAYRGFVAQGIGLPSVWEGLRGRMWLGDEQFRSQMQRRLGVKRGADVSRAQREPARPNPDELLTEVAKAFGLARGAVQCSARPPPRAGVSWCGVSAAKGRERTDWKGCAACRDIRSAGVANSGRGGERQAARADADAVEAL